MSSSAELLTQAEAELESGDAQAAVRTLRFLHDSELHTDDDALRRLIALLERAGAAEELQEMVESAQAAIGLDPQPLYDFAAVLMQVGLSELAVPLLERVSREAPGEPPVVAALVAALEESEQYAAARDVLLAHESLLDEVYLRYLLCFTAICAGDLATARAHAGLLITSDPDLEQLADRIGAMLRRADRVELISKLDEHDVRGWRYVLSGALLLHISPFGFQEGMSGRYAFLQDDPSSIRRDIEALVAVLEAQDRLPDRVLSLPDRGSRIMADAVGIALGVPVEPFAADIRGLVVGYDLDALIDDDDQADLLDALYTRPDDCPLFLRCVRWTAPTGIIPDLIGLVHQLNTPPWGEQMRLGEDQEVEMAPPSEDPIETWATRIMTAPLESDPEDEAPVDSREALLAFAELAVPDRGDMFPTGPVASSRFS